MKRPTYQDILKAEAEMLEDVTIPYALRAGINSVLANAEDNAQDDDGRVASIICILSFSDTDRDQAVDDWFADIGIVP